MLISPSRTSPNCAGVDRRRIRPEHGRPAFGDKQVFDGPAGMPHNGDVEAAYAEVALHEAHLAAVDHRGGWQLDPPYGSSPREK
jgi:hypothetical protein